MLRESADLAVARKGFRILGVIGAAVALGGVFSAANIAFQGNF
ncbi:hypothetical protein LG3211_1986 [Lysobacter gummosus]|nr:hypothetical protein LG3211_1986 [Lysobacter gummosus]